MYLNVHHFQNNRYRGTPWPNDWNVCFSTRGHRFDSTGNRQEFFLRMPAINYQTGQLIWLLIWL